MGRSNQYACEVCGFRALVSGGADRGFFVRTQTMFCADCKTLADVVTDRTYDPTHPCSPLKDEELSRVCPRCSGRELKAWNDGDGCPLCGADKLINGGALELWD
jgi:hypothetical protein